MKKILLILIGGFFGILSSANAQDTLSAWTFPTGTDMDSNANDGIYTAYSIHTFGGTDKITFSKNGLTTKAAQATAWNNGANSKGWEIRTMTQGYKDILVLSKQTSGGNNPGPRDFKLQYSLDNIVWTDVANAIVNVQNDWTSGVLSVGLPTNCNDEVSVRIRWIMVSDTASDGSLVAANGTGKIDDIFILGTKINTGFENVSKIESSIYPNPVVDILYANDVQEFTIYTSSGQLIKNYKLNQKQSSVDLSDIEKGIYFVRMINFDQEISSQTLLKK
ncbi:MAG: T9SS type A sorting domain-containing protein [Bacteroidetes bacterium]|nr:T9SS type A sorting domain-containing protein [Bacteroidota bacterium]